MALSERDRRLIVIVAGVAGFLLMAFILISLASVPGAATNVSPPPSVAFVQPQTFSPLPSSSPTVPPPPTSEARDPFAIPCSLGGSPSLGSTCTPSTTSSATPTG
jgi:hypothetical protein